MEVKARLHKARFFVECDLADKKMEKKIREAQLDQFNYILVSNLVCFACLTSFSASSNYFQLQCQGMRSMRNASVVPYLFAEIL